MKKLLLISNSILYGQGYLEHCKSDIRNFLKGIKEILFIPYALKDYDAYAKTVNDYFSTIDISVKGIHTTDPQTSIVEASSLFIGGGNTFRLLNELYKLDIIEAIRERVINGMPYIGSSAGVNVACPTIKTTNDMPIVYPPSFNGLNLIPFQINPHYIDADPRSTHQGETREQRLKEFCEENNQSVIGLREGAWFWIENERTILKGKTGAKLFKQDGTTYEFKEGDIVEI